MHVHECFRFVEVCPERDLEMIMYYAQIVATRCLVALVMSLQVRPLTMTYLLT